MASNYWIKLYHEVLDDPKMGQLPDRLWRRVVELFLIAGDYDQKGVLPEIADMAWRLRLTEDVLKADLDTIREHGIAEWNVTDGWIITHFATRQGAASNARRAERHRDKQRHDQYTGNEPVTDDERTRNGTRNESLQDRVSDTDTDTDTDTEEIRVDVDAPSETNAFNLYEQAAGMLSPLVSEKIADLIDDSEKHRLTLGDGVPGSDLTGDAWVQNAIMAAVAAGAQRISPNYLDAVLKRWRAEGYKSQRKNGARPTTQESNMTMLDEMLQKAEAVEAGR